MKKQVLVTTSWDDGHRLDLKLALLLMKYGIKGTFYISPNNREWPKDNLLTNKEIKELSQNFEIGAHTMTHPLLTKIGQKEAFREIKDSKTFLEKLINKNVNMFCYPSGLYSENIKHLVKKAGYDGARTVKRFCVGRPSDVFELGTTVHVFRYRLNFGSKLPLKVNLALTPTLLTKDWVSVAQKTFDFISTNGGVFHLWGHSWEIAKNNDWKKLELVLRYISNKPNTTYVSNSELFYKRYEK
jgi:peptidoglycan-N-acetylglucosamine deacetylase